MGCGEGDCESGRIGGHFWRVWRGCGFGYAQPAGCAVTDLAEVLPPRAERSRSPAVLNQRKHWDVVVECCDLTTVREVTD
jgi:hypothetical protein